MLPASSTIKKKTCSGESVTVLFCRWPTRETVSFVQIQCTFHSLRDSISRLVLWIHPTTRGMACVKCRCSGFVKYWLENSRTIIIIETSQRSKRLRDDFHYHYFLSFMKFSVSKILNEIPKYLCSAQRRTVALNALLEHSSMCTFSSSNTTSSMPF